MELFKELPLDLQLKIFDVYEEERYRIDDEAKRINDIMLDELELYSETFSDGVEWDINLFMFVRRWEENQEDFTF
jgi:hypothetical protein